VLVPEPPGEPVAVNKVIAFPPVPFAVKGTDAD
jgi:hypothetical protein